MNARKRAYLVDSVVGMTPDSYFLRTYFVYSQLLTHLLHQKPPGEKDHPSLVSLARFQVGDDVCEGFSSLFACELAMWARTVRQVLRQKIPALARGVRSLDECRDWHDLRKDVVKVSATRGKKVGERVRKRDN